MNQAKFLRLLRACPPGLLPMLFLKPKLLVAALRVF